MVELITGILGDFLFWFEYDKYQKRRTKRRTYKKKNNIPHKTTIPPTLKILFILLIIGVISYFLLNHYYLLNLGERKTKTKLIEVERLLQKEKTELGKYPEELELIIRNRPLRKKIIFDYWGNKFNYSLLENGEKYELFSLGKDKIINTSDDIKTSKKNN